MPLKTVIPIDLRALAPAPLAITKGRTPRMKEKDVIRIGRKRADDAVERRGHVGITEIDFGLPFVGLRGLQIRLRGVALRQRFIVIGLCRYLPGNEIGLTLVFGLGLFERRLGARDGRFSALNLSL